MRQPIIKGWFLKALAVCYGFAGGLHVLDLLDLRLSFSEMSPVWKAWILYLMFADMSASIGLWLEKKWGVFLWLFIAGSQLLVYTVFSSQFGDQSFLIRFHWVTVGIWTLLVLASHRRSSGLLD